MYVQQKEPNMGELDFLKHPQTCCEHKRIWPIVGKKEQAIVII